MAQSIEAGGSAQKPACPWRNFEPCLGVGCMAWTWSDRAFECATTNNLVSTPDGMRPGVDDPPMPDGDGWERRGPPRKAGYHRSAKDGLPPALEQAWWRRVDRTRGFCGRIGGGYGSDDEIPF